MLSFHSLIHDKLNIHDLTLVTPKQHPASGHNVGGMSILNFYDVTLVVLDPGRRQISFLEYLLEKSDAKRLYKEFCVREGRNSTSISTERMEDGTWLFIERNENPPQGSFDGVAVRSDSRVFPFNGAIGKVFRDNKKKIGAPKTLERFLCSAYRGCHQTFDSGCAIWEAGDEKHGGTDIGYLLSESLDPLESRECTVAVFDLRGFTLWSGDKSLKNVQLAIEAFEDSVHEAFPYSKTGKDDFPWKSLFLKGTGDGVIIISQADWYRNADKKRGLKTLENGHATEFLNACELVLFRGQERFHELGLPLAIGCGISSGELRRVFLFGRFDFLGPAVNDASKIQGHAWDEICVTEAFWNHLLKDGRPADAGKALPGKGYRLKISSE